MKFKEYLQAKYASVLNRLDWPCLIYEKQKIRYRELTGKKLSFRNPVDINEKLLWLNRYWRDPIKSKCADKFLVRNYIKDRGLENLLVPLIGVYSNTDEIVYDRLPSAFALKCNHGSGYNLICTDKSKMEWADAKRKLNQWMASDYSRRFGEFHYSTIERKIVCEKLISDVAPIEYQCWCTNGEPDSFLVCRKNFDGTYDAWSYSLDGKRLFERKDELPPPPDDLSHDDKDDLFDLETAQKVVLYARRLAAPFPFVRSDFYVVNKRIYFAELTFTPAACILSAYNDEFITRLGKKLILPNY